MKRVILTSAATVAGVVALLSFKTQPLPVAAATTLPSAGPDETDATPQPSSTPRPSATRATTRTYTGQAVTTRYGIVQVEVSVSRSKIKNVAFTQLTAFDRHSEEINSWAGPHLLQETLDNQSDQVDAVSGATYTSDGYRRSLQSALDQAGL